MEYKMEKERVMTNGYTLERANEKDILYAQSFYMREFSNKDQFLRVYIDDDKNKYYIDVFAAFALKMISYKSACDEFDRGMQLFEISESVLNMLRDVFKDKIEYKYLSRQRDNNYLENENYNLDNFDDKSLKDEFNDMFSEVPDIYIDNNNFQK